MMGNIVYLAIRKPYKISLFRKVYYGTRGNLGIRMESMRFNLILQLQT